MKVQEFIQSLFEIEINAHIAHLQTSSYAQHMALNTLYTDVVDIRDKFAESYQGQYGILKGFSGTISIKEGVDMVSYINSLKTPLNGFRESLTDGYLQQIVDDLFELLNSTVYKLKFLE